MAKKYYRADNTYLIEGGIGDNPKLMGRALSDGRDSLYLEFYLGKVGAVSRDGREYMKNERRTEPLGLYLWRAPRTPRERKENKEVLEIAKRRRFERGQDLLEGRGGFRLKKRGPQNVIEWMWSYYDEYTKADRRHIRRAVFIFLDYLEDRTGERIPAKRYGKRVIVDAAADKEHRCRGMRLEPRHFTPKLAEGFALYLQRRFTGEGPHTLFKRFKKISLAAVAAEVLPKDPCAAVTIKVDEGALVKDVLSMEEIKRLMETHCPGENVDVRRAFIFCLYCGLRWCDVKDLRYANVDRANRLLRFEQAKTKGRSAASAVTIPLNEGLLRLIGEGQRSDLIFPLPSHTMCLKALRHWTAQAGIDKHITWHCARHSFAVNILNNGANIKTVASLLGHSGLRYTEKYTRAVDALKVAAINSLPGLE